MGKLTCKNGDAANENGECNCNNIPDNYSLWKPAVFNANVCYCNPGTTKHLGQMDPVTGLIEQTCKCTNDLFEMDDKFNCYLPNHNAAPPGTGYIIGITFAGMLSVVGLVLILKPFVDSIRIARRNAALVAPPVNMNINPILL